MFRKGGTHRITISIETFWFATTGMTHLLQNGCLSSVGIADDQDSKAFNSLLGVLEKKLGRLMRSPYKISVWKSLLRHYDMS